MAFQQGLSGLNAASKGLDVTSNNIANTSTAGFKSSSAHFADVFSSSMAGGGASQVGIGVSMSAVQQQFTQGNITITNNPLDLSINGNGFFRMDRGGTVTYTRNGQFHTDRNGYIINDQDLRLTGYPADDNGLVVPSTPVPLQISAADLAPVATGGSTGGILQGVLANINLDSRESTPPNPWVNGPASGQWNPSPTTYNYSTALSVYDTLGNPHTMTFYFVKTANQGEWNMYANVDGTTNVRLGAPAAPSAQGVGTFTVGTDYTISSIGDTDWNAVSGGTLTAPYSVGMSFTAAIAGDGTTANPGTATATVATGAGALGTLQFDTYGQLTSGAINAASINLDGVLADLGDPNNAASPLAFNVDLTGSTQFGSSFGVNRLEQDGYTSGRLTGLSVGSDGMIQGRYTNGQTRNQGQVVLANFTNPNGLQSLGNNQWGETSVSGAPQVGSPNTSSLGVLQSAAIEESNVDLTAELVNMITQQRNYQANAQSIKTQDSIMNTLVNLR